MIGIVAIILMLALVVWYLLSVESDYHSYLSTACYHERHDDCRMVCKFCYVQCRCKCHKEAKSEISG